MPNPVVHFEIGGRESEKTQRFFTELFDWKTEVAGAAAMISTRSDEGIQGHITALGHEPFNYVTIYVQVDDLQAYLDKAESLGGKAIIPPTDVPGMGAFAWFSDIDGNTIGLWKPIEQTSP